MIVDMKQIVAVRIVKMNFILNDYISNIDRKITL